MLSAQIWLFTVLKFCCENAYVACSYMVDAHVEAPTAGYSVILAGVLFKWVAGGFYVFSLPMLPEASEFFAPMIFLASVA
jgi:NADH-quinone oxidoreductase subunit M